MKKKTFAVLCALVLCVGVVFGVTACDSCTFGHNYGEWQTITAATATKDGKRERKCANCDAKEEEVIPSSCGEAFTFSQEWSSIVFTLKPKAGQTKLANIYVNLSNSGDAEGEVQVDYRYQTAGWWLTGSFGKVAIQPNPDGEWLTPFDLSFVTYELRDRNIYRVWSKSGEISLNEIIFVAEDGKPIPVEINSDLSENVDVTLAKNTIDTQVLPQA